MSSEEKMIIPKKQMLIALGVIILLIILSVFLIAQSTDSSGQTQEQQEENQTPDGLNQLSNDTGLGQRLPFIKIISLKKPDCGKCVSLDFLVEAIKTQFDVNVLEVKEVESDSQQGLDLIAMHEIKKLPTLIINGEFQGTELQQLWSAVGDESNGVLILRTVEPPYFSLEENRLVGGVNFLLIQKSDCIECEDLTSFSDYIEDLNVLIENKKTIEFDSEEAQEILDYYLISTIPVVVLKGDLEEYEYFSVLWIQGGGYTDEGAYIYEEAVPFFDLDSKEVKGLVEITRIIDENCSDCIDSNVLAAPLVDQMRMKVIKDTTYTIDSSEGQALIEEYSITKVPTIIVSSEAEYYGEFTYAWEQVGTQEEDGVFVFRNLELLEGNFTSLE